MTQLKPFTKDDIQKGAYRGEQLRRWHEYLQRAKENDIRELKNIEHKKYKFKQKQTTR